MALSLLAPSTSTGSAQGKDGKPLEERVKELEKYVDSMGYLLQAQSFGMIALLGFLMYSRRSFSGKVVITERLLLVEPMKQQQQQQTSTASAGSLIERLRTTLGARRRVLADLNAKEDSRGAYFRMRGGHVELTDMSWKPVVVAGHQVMTTEETSSAKQTTRSGIILQGEAPEKVPESSCWLSPSTESRDSPMGQSGIFVVQHHPFRR